MIKKREYLFELASGWEWTNFEELAESIPNALKAGPFGSALKKSFYVQKGYKIYGQEQVIKEDPFYGDYYIDEKRYEVLKSCAVKPGDILISLVGTIGKVLILPEGIEPGIINPRLVKLSLEKKLILADYIKKYLESSLVRNYLSSLSHGGTMDILNLTILKTLPITLPPLNEQKRIVGKIEALQRRSQRVKEAIDAIPQLLDQFRQSVLAAAFRGDLTADWRENNPDVEPASVLLEKIRAERRRKWEEAELEKMMAKGKIPKDDKWKQKYKEPEKLELDKLLSCPDSWSWVRAEEVCDFITKGTTPAARKMSEQTGDIPFIKVYNLTNIGTLDFSINPTFISKEVHDNELARSKIYPGDVLMNIVGPPLGKVAIVPNDYEEWNMNQAIAVYRTLPGVNNSFLCCCLLSTEILSTAIRLAKATAGQFNLTLEICRNLPLPIPPTSEQLEINKIIKRFFKAADTIQQQYQETKANLDLLNQSILAKAFRGELVPQNPNDEPASILLESIRAEREKLQQQTKAAKKYKGKTTKRRSKKAPQQPEEAIQLELPGIEEEG